MALNLTVTIIKAENIKAADKSGSSDPYFRAYLKDILGNDLLKVFRSKPLKKNLNPVFNMRWNDLTSMGLTDTILIELWDKDTFGKDFLGYVEVVPGDIGHSGIYEFALKGRNGKDVGITGSLFLDVSLTDETDVVNDGNVTNTSSVTVISAGIVIDNDDDTSSGDEASYCYGLTHVADVPKRVNASALIVDNKLVILGGCQGYSKYLSFASVVDLNTKEVTEVENINPAIRASEEAFCCTIGDIGYFIPQSEISSVSIFLVKSTGDSVVIEEHMVTGATLESPVSFMFISNGFQRGTDIYMMGKNLVKLDTTVFTTEDNVNTYTWEEVPFTGDASFLNALSNGLMYPFVYCSEWDEVLFASNTPEDSSKEIGCCVYNFETSSFTERDLTQHITQFPKSGSRAIMYKDVVFYTGGKNLMDDYSDNGPDAFSYEYKLRNGVVTQRQFQLDGLSSISDRKSHFMVTQGSRIFLGLGVNEDDQLGDIWEMTEQ